MEKLLITGVNGLLGQKVLEQAASRYAVLGVDLQAEPVLKKIKFEYRKLDLTDRRKVKELLLAFHPAYLVNTAAMTDVDGCETEKERCWRINVEAVEHIVYAAQMTGTRIVHISSDYVFDGKNGPYSEESLPSPLGYYGRSKLASENLLNAADVEHAIVRTMVLYGHGIDVRPNFVTWLLEKLRQRQPVKVVTDQIGNPTLADDLATAILKIIELKKWDLFHICGSEAIDRYQFAQKIAAIFKLDKALISAITTHELKQAAPRPLKSGFIIDKALTQLAIHMSGIDEGLKKMKKEYKQFPFNLF